MGIFQKSFLLASLLLLFPFVSKAYCENGTAAAISQYGITWTFDKEYQCGQFVNGDYWVLDPGPGVNVVNIDPGYALVGSRFENGSMLNPVPEKQGYDSYAGSLAYNSDTNVGIGISRLNPLILAGDNSLVSSISNAIPANPSPYVSYLKTAAVLTCLRAVPPAGTFRPAYSDRDKSLYNFSNLDLSLLMKLAVPAGQNVSSSTLATYAGYFQRPWLMHNGSWTSRYLHPNENVFSDNYYFPRTLSEAALLLNLNFSDAEKKKLLTNYIQLGIDLYGIVKAGQKGWAGEGGFGSGRKWPILFAGLMLNDAGMKSIGKLSGDYLYANGHGAGNAPLDYVSFAEDAQTFYVTQAEIDISNSAAWKPDTRTAPNFPYDSSMLGMPEWGIRHYMQPGQSDSSWGANYRTIGSGGPIWAGTALAAMMMNAKALWNHNAYFDYVDRYMSISKDGSDPFGYSVDRQAAGNRNGGIIAAMYDAYRYKISPATCFDRMKNQDETGIDSGGVCAAALLRGDADGNKLITSVDALLALRNSLGLSMAGTAWKADANVDANCDGKVSSSDALLILRYSLGLSMAGTAWCGN